MTADPRLAAQEALEDHAMNEGQKRFRRKIEEARRHGEEATVGAGLSLVRKAIDPLSLALSQMIEDAKGVRGVKHIAVKVVGQLGPDVAAYMTVRSVLNSALAHHHLVATADHLAALMMDELRFRRLREQAPALFDYKINSFDTSSYEHRSKSLAHTLRTATVREQGGEESVGVNVSDLDLTPQQARALGLKCIALLVDVADIVTVEDRQKALRSKRDSHKSYKLLVVTPEALEWIHEKNGAMELLWPVALPMVVEPLPWAPGVRGGYRFALQGRYPLVRGISKAHARTVAMRDMPIVYTALNALQRTPWRINPDVHALLQDIVRMGGGWGGVPELRHEELPGKPEADADFDRIIKTRRKVLREDPGANLPVMEAKLAEYVKTWKAWKGRAAETHNVNYSRKINRQDMGRLLDVVERFAAEARLYFVYNCDFRGRVYPVSNYLSPQGDDTSKGLLTFADGQPLGAEGARYLAQHGANCLGETPDGLKVSTLTIAERVRWIEAHTERILEIPEDPFGRGQWWAKADDPLQFYAFACEWKRLTEWRAAGLPDADFVSALPCAVDGSNNGLQHYAMAWRDEVGGVEVNLTPEQRPHDIYRVITLDVTDQLTALAAEGHENARLWLTSHLITRKLCKRPVMTFPYGSKEFGFKSQFIHHLKTKLGQNAAESTRIYKTVVLPHFTSPKGFETKRVGDLLGKASMDLAVLSMRALKPAVPRAHHGMSWLQAAARLVSTTGQCVTWTVPSTGFLVRQEYMEMKERRIETILCGKVYRPVVQEPTSKPARYKQANAVAPNVIHSLDAAALMLTVQQAAAAGVTSFAMVHDSYGAPAGDMATVARCCRQSFYRLYTEQDVVAELHAQFLAQLPEEKQRKKMQDPPAKGSLDPAGVLVSDYFFA